MVSVIQARDEDPDQVVSPPFRDPEIWDVMDRNIGMLSLLKHHEHR